MEMDDYNIVISILLVFFFLMIASSGATSTFPMSKPGCEDQVYCGNVSIPFPFGTREGCYRDEGFLIRCLNSSKDAVVDPPQPVLERSTIIVKDVSLEGQLRIMYHVGYDCYDPKKNNTPSDYVGRWMTLAPPKVFNSTANKFTAIGCDTHALVKGASYDYKYFYTSGCISTCGSKEDVKDGSCSGVGCCQTSIPSGAWEINVTLSSYNNHASVSDFNPCSYVFVMEEAALKFFADNLSNFDKAISVPIVVDWVVAYEKCEEAKKNWSSYACKTENSVCYDQEGARGYRCKCKEGFDGNPYLGCQDIDECENSTLINCANHSSCINTAGSYLCQCNQGYHGDGRKDGERCIADPQPLADPQPHKKNYWPIYAVVAVTTGCVILVAFSFCVYSRVMRRKADRLREEFFRKNGGLILEQKITGQGGGTYATRIFTVEELKKATNDFDESQIIGQGGFGIVFKGELMDNTKVAIKRSRGVDHHQVEQFVNEVIVLSGINNRNVVKLLGCCLETEVPLLVYEFINNGTLFGHLHSKIKASKLTWNIRLRIAREVAGVLSYLHSVASPPIIHRDVKSSNILLDQNCTAKVSDFGISRLIPMDEIELCTVVQGTHGYLDPEYLQTCLLTEKSDVYSFGVVLLELLTGKKVLESNRPEAEKFLSNHFLYSLKEDHLFRVLDINISCNENNIDQIKEVAMIAKRCISVKGEDRPHMKDVARELEALETKSQQIPVVQAFEICSTETEAFLGMQSNIYASSDANSDANPTSSDLYPVSDTTMKQILLPLGGGR